MDSMPARANELIETLGLQPHPEGGRFREVYRSSLQVSADGRERPALTTIFFLLTRGQQSRWHRVRSDEVWHFYEGDPLELIQLAETDWEPKTIRLGRADERTLPVHSVPADCWQAARPLGEFTLVGCTVAPGFDFDDFTMLSDLPVLADDLRRRLPRLAGLI